MRPHRPTATSLIVAALLPALAGCFSERSQGVIDPAQEECRVALSSPVFGAPQALVAIRDFAFSPAEIRVQRGTTVTWINCEPPTIDPHTSTSNVRIWGSALLGPGETYSRTFDEAGRFPYHCEPHPFMQAVVIVE
jgi:plastocyanin